MDLSKKKIAVIGLGYVGLPLAVAFSKKFDVLGFDIDKKRIEELKRFKDRSMEFSKEDLLDLKIKLTYSKEDLKKANVYIITVPTPVDDNNIPNLIHLEQATKMVGNYLEKGDLVVFESTVYPGATEEFCVPILQSNSNLILNKDFYCGYSPERINPGDQKHKIGDILKLTSGSNETALEIVDGLYKKIIKAGTYKTYSIKIAEAAKVIENTQRDLNIALINELSLIFNRLDIDTNKVLDAASTKWNFIKFTPGLVGGHCIGVDPYYLTYKAQQTGYTPEVILSGRNVNNKMPFFVSDQTIKLMKSKGIEISKSKILVLGAAFKENCPDIRNSKVIDLIKSLENNGISVECYDPLVSSEDKKKTNISWIDKLDESMKFDAIIFAVPHDILMIDINHILNLKKTTSVVFDIKGFLPEALVDGRL